MGTIIEVNNLCKTYIINKRQNHVLKNVNFKIEEGEMLGVMGPSGSGKSTLLYMVSGMDHATTGSVNFLSRELVSMKDALLAKIRLDDCGFIFQQMYMMKNLSIIDNIILPAAQSEKNKGKKKEVNKYAEQLMRKLGIIELAENDINEASGGELQRACICRSLINHPKVVFADEPTGALNRKASDEVMNEIEKINSEGTTVMMVTHDVKVAAKCKRVIYLVDGNIKGEYNLDSENKNIIEKERILNNWLLDMGW